MNCQDTGYTEGSFASRAWQEHESTKYYRVRTRDVFLWSYAGEAADGTESVFCFRSLMGSGKGQHEKCLSIKKDTSFMEGALSCAGLHAAFNGGLFVSGICPEDRNRMFAFTEQGLRSFSDTLRAYGKGIKKAPDEAGAYAAELFSKADPDKEWIFCVKDNGGLSGRVIGVCSGRYVGNGPLGVYTAYLAVKRGFEKRGLTLSFRKWEIYGGGVRVYAQCPGLFDGGILISDSDSGKQAFSMYAVFGDPFSKGHTIISRHSLRHTSSMDPAQFCRERIPDMISEIREWSYRQKYTAAA